MRRLRAAYPIAGASIIGLVGVLGTGVALAAWLVTGSATLHTAAATMSAGNAPSATASGSTVHVTWPANEIVAGTPVTGYRVVRYDGGGTAQPAQGGCSGVVSSAGCTEPGVPDGSWTYRVQPVEGTQWTGAPSDPSGTVVVSTVSVTFPEAANYGVASWNKGCGTAASGDICGTAVTAPGVKLSKVEVRLSGGGWEQSFDAGKTANWRVPFAVDAFPGAGSYTVRAVVTDANGRRSETSRTFTVHPEVPPVPTFTATPPALTNQTSATFGFDSSRNDVTFECSLDNATFSGCTSGVTVHSLTSRSHRFRVQARDGGDNVSPVATATWTVDASAPQATDVQASGGTAGVIEAGDRLTLSYSEPMAPASLVAGWDGGALPVTVRISGTTVTIHDGANGAQLTAFGSVDLAKPGYVGQAVAVPASMVLSGDTVTITLGALDNPPAAVTVAGNMRWTPGGGSDLAGNALGDAGQVTAEKHAAGADVEF
jgi:hypothetical protein